MVGATLTMVMYLQSKFIRPKMPVVQLYEGEL